jgi:choline dehydrogenase-like flavoprotein
MGSNDVDGVYDYIVVGAGSAGCTLAGRLSEDTDLRVLLLEAGPMDDVPNMDVPLAFPMFMKSRYDWDLQTDAEPGLNDRTIYLAHGRVLGGSSSINSMVYLRGSRADYDDWARDGATGWSYDEVLPYFRRAEDNERGETHYHGVGGPLSVSDGRSKHPLGAAFLEAAQQAGYRLSDDLNGPSQEGIGYVQVTQRNGRRCSAATAYLHPNLSRPNLSVRVEAHVTQVLFEGDRAVGVEVERFGQLERYRVDREVILSAGAYHSPKMLMLAGIGPAAHLSQLGIPVRQDLPTGQHLNDHVMVGIVFRTPIPSLLSAFTADNVAQFERDGTGPVSSNVGETSGFIRSHADAEAADFQVNGVPVMFGGMAEVSENGASIVGWTSKPTSRGHVKLRSTDPFTKPRILHNYLTTEADRRTACDGVRRMLEISQQRAYRDIVSGVIAVPDSTTDEDILAFARHNGSTNWHPTSSCAIGHVVDPELKVYGVEGLRVVDASVMPTVPRSNTNAPTIMIAEKAVDLVLGRVPLPPAVATRIQAVNRPCGDEETRAVGAI